MSVFAILQTGLARRGQGGWDGFHNVFNALLLSVAVFGLRTGPRGGANQIGWGWVGRVGVRSVRVVGSGLADLD